MAAKGLTPKQQAFVDEYLVDLNATQAAIRAGYSAKNADVTGPRLLGNVGIAAAVQAALEDRAERTELTADRVVAELAAIAFADLRDVTEWGREQDDEGNLRALVRLRESGDLSDEVAAALAEVKLDSHGSLSVRLYDKLRALELLGRHLGLFKKDAAVNVNIGITLDRLHELAGDGDS